MNKNNKENSKKEIVIGVVLGCFAVFCTMGFIAWTWVPNWQMSEYVSILTSGQNREKMAELFQQDSPIFNPDTYAQGTLRQDFVEIMLQQPSVPDEFWNLATGELEDYISKHPHNYLLYVDLAKAYDTLGQKKNDPSYFDKAEQNYQKAFQIIPERQDLIYSYSVHLEMTKRGEQAISLLEKQVKQNPDVAMGHMQYGMALMGLGESRYNDTFAELEFALSHGANGNSSILNQFYQKMLKYFYAKGDVERFRNAAFRLTSIDNTNQKAIYERMVAYVDANHSLPKINFDSAK